MGYTYKMTQVLVAVGPRIQFLLNRIHLVCMCVCESRCACLLHTACVPSIVVYIILYLILHIHHVLSKLKTTCEACNAELGINHVKTHHVHQMIQYTNNLILILFNIDET